MKGRTSIKYVLPAVWSNNSYLHEIPWLRKYFKEEDGKALDPYQTLAEIEIAGQAESVKEGTGAMRAYEDMVYGINSHNPEIKQQRAILLKEYCKLDTLAMVIIWRYWNDLVKQ